MGEHCDFENEHMPWLRHEAMNPRPSGAKARNRQLVVTLNPTQMRAYRAIGGAPALKRMLMREESRSEEMAESLFQHIAHGDEARRAWLRNAAIEWATAWCAKDRNPQGGDAPAAPGGA